MLRCERIETALRERVWTVSQRDSGRLWHGLLLQSGEAVVEDYEQTSWLDPAMVYLAPTSQIRSLRVRAGAEGVLFQFDQRRAADAAGHGPDSNEFLQLLENRLVVRLDEQSNSLAGMEYALALVMGERGETAPGSESLLDAALKLVLVVLLRNLPATPRAAALANVDRSTASLQHFRNLLEMRFRERWGVAHYAAALGIGPDRLHDLCTTRLGRAPSDLIAERAGYEARLLLDNAALSVTDVAHRLGFRDPSHFSRFFSRLYEESPRAYRQRRAAQADRHEVTPQNFADWP